MGVEFEASTQLQDTSVAFGYQLELPKGNLLFRGTVWGGGHPKKISKGGHPKNLGGLRGGCPGNVGEVGRRERGRGCARPPPRKKK